VTPLPLTRLTRSQIEEMVRRVTGGKPLPTEVVQQIMAKTDGIPLFVEELVKTILEAGLVQEEAGRYVLPGPLPPLAIPATLQDALMARLDRLRAVKDVAQLGAVLGREFAYELLRAVASLDEATLQHGLAQLVEAELLYQRGIPPQAIYLFKHALIRDAAYESLLRSTRQQYHQRIAQVLEAQFPETTEAQPELLAHHFMHAGLHEPAVDYWYKAGQRASARSAPREAISHLHQGLEVLTALSDTPDRTRQELRFYLALGAPLTALHGYAAPELADYHRHTRELCQRIGDPEQYYTVVGGLLSLHLVRADLRTARELAEERLHLAQGGMSAAHLVDAHRMLGNICVHLGEFQAARVQLEQGVAIAATRLPQHSILLDAGGTQDPRTSCLTWLALDLWALGYPDQARQRGDEGIALAQQLAYPFNLTVAFNQWLRLQHLCRTLHLPLAVERAETSRRLATEHSFVQQMANETYRQGLLLAQQGQLTEGIAQMQQGWVAYRATGANVRQPMYLAPLAEAYGQAGQVDEGLQVLAEALVYVEQAGERWWEAELHRLKGELLLIRSSDNYATAESCFFQALDLARQQQAKSWELRTATSLAQLWKQQGKRHATRQVLAEVYGWFTEGFDTADLQEARALLDELA
jgi:predicted ATPase